MIEREDLPVAGTAVILRDGAAGIEVLLMRRPQTGSFADAWVFPGGRVEEADRMPGAGESEDACRAAIRETFEEVGIQVSELSTLSCWHPPAEAPRRIRTWFFLGADPGAEILASADEVVDVVWIRPADALARHAAGEWTLFPPTWVTLHGLRGRASVADTLSSPRAVRDYRTRVQETPAGRVFVWGADRLETGSLPWRLVTAEAGSEGEQPAQV